MPAKPRQRLVVIVAIILAFGSPSSATKPPDELASVSVRTASPSAESTDTTADRPSPDVVAEYVGGIAARLHSSDGIPIAGQLFVLMASAGSDAPARFFDQTPYTHSNGTAADTLESNLAAAETVETITGVDVGHVEFTTPPGGGSSTGLIYAIAYLNVVSDGGFTGDLRIAATGRLGPDGYINSVSASNEKTAAAHLADVDVFLSPSSLADDHIRAYGSRSVGELSGARNTGSTLRDERHLDEYRRWGVERPEGMDIVGARHIADVAAYLCGTGSGYACHVLDVLDDTVIGGPSDTERIRPAVTPIPAGLH